MKTLTIRSCLHFSAFAMIACALFPSANALAATDVEPEFYFYPSKPWSSGKLTQAGDEGGICALQSHFNNGYVLQFDGSSRWVESLSINFRQNIFEASKTYPLTVSIPGGGESQLQAVAVSPSVLKASMSQQDNLFEALQASSTMDIGVQENNFRFYLTGMADAAKSFETCMGGAAIADASAKIEKPEGEKIAPSDDRFNESIAFEQQEKDLAIIASQPVMTPEAPAAATAVAAVTVEPVAPGVVEEPAPVALPPAEPVLEPLPEIAVSDAAPDEPTMVEETVSEVMPAPGRATINKTTSRIEADFTKFEDDQVEAKSSRLNREAPSSGADNFVAADERGSEYRDKIVELEQRLRLLENENGALKDELQVTLEEGRTEHTQISNENWNLERASMRYQEAERQLKKIGLQLQKQKAQCDVEKRELEAMLFDPQVTNQEQLAKLADLEEKLAEAEEKLANMRLQSAERERIRDSLDVIP